MKRVFVGFIRDHRVRIGRIIDRRVRLRYGCKSEVKN